MLLSHLTDNVYCKIRTDHVTQLLKSKRTAKKVQADAHESAQNYAHTG